MRALVRDVYGSPEVLRLDDVADPLPREGHAVVRVVASSINDWDYLLLLGSPWVNRVSGPRRPRQRVLGSDVAGVVESVGPAVDNVRVGDRVLADASASGFGAFAELVSLPGASLVAVPDDVPLAVAGVLPQAGGLAQSGLDWRGGVRPGDRVLVNGAGGGVGTLAVQLARAAGARVTGADRADKLEAVRRCGADSAIDIAGGDLSTRGEVYDRVLDVAMHRSWRAARRLLDRGGCYGVIGGDLRRVIPLFALGPLPSLVGDRALGVPHWNASDRDQLASLCRLVQEGVLVPVVDSTVALDGVPDAFRRFGASRHVGKIAVRIADEG